MTKAILNSLFLIFIIFVFCFLLQWLHGRKKLLQETRSWNRHVLKKMVKKPGYPENGQWFLDMFLAGKCACWFLGCAPPLRPYFWKAMAPDGFDSWQSLIEENCISHLTFFQPAMNLVLKLRWGLLRSKLRGPRRSLVFELTINGTVFKMIFSLKLFLRSSVRL